MTEVAAGSPPWAEYQGRLVAQLRRECESTAEGGSYYLVDGSACSASAALDAALAHIARYDPPKIRETRHGDALHLYQVRTPDDLRELDEYAAEEIEWAYEDDIETVLKELETLAVTWEPSEPPCRDDTGVERTAHMWRSRSAWPAEDMQAGGLYTHETCEHCGAVRCMDLWRDDRGDHAETPTTAYLAADGMTPILCDGVPRERGGARCDLS